MHQLQRRICKTAVLYVHVLNQHISAKKPLEASGPLEGPARDRRSSCTARTGGWVWN